MFTPENLLCIAAGAIFGAVGWEVFCRIELWRHRRRIRRFTEFPTRRL